MKRVSVVGTVHDEAGLASISGLVAILERINPEVIFLEIHSADFDDYYVKRTRTNLESSAVVQFCETHHVTLVPVDLPRPEDHFFRNHEEMGRTIMRTSLACRQLIDWHSQRVRESGFVYLNSDQCSALWPKLHDATLAAIERLPDRKWLGEVYELWITTSELREKEWVKNIRHYSRETSFSNGVFLVGAAHRQSLSDRSLGQPGDGSSPIVWVFSGFLGAPEGEPHA